MSVDPHAGVPALARPVSRPDVVFRELAREWVLYDPRSRRIHVLNLTAALVWSLCDGQHAPDDIVHLVGDLMGDAPAPAALGRDVDDALRVFADEGLLA